MNDYLYHHGIKGQKWGVRRFQNSDGSLTRAGKLRYEVKDARHRYKTYAGDTASRALVMVTPAGLSKKVRRKGIDSAIEMNTARLNYKGKKSQYRIEKKREEGASDKKLARMEYRQGLKMAKLKAQTNLTNESNRTNRRMSTGRYVVSTLLNVGMPGTIHALEQTGMSRRGAVATNILLGNVGSNSVALFITGHQAKKNYKETHNKKPT